MSKITITVKVDGDVRTFVKHISGGTDRQVVEVGPNAEFSFDAREFEGDNLFIISPAVAVAHDPIAVQEASKTDHAVGAEVNVAKEESKDDAKKDASSSKSSADAKEGSWPSKVADKTEDAKSGASTKK